MSRGPLTREGLCARAFTHKEKPRLSVVSQTGSGVPGAGRRLLEKGLAWIGQTRPALTRATAAAITCVGPTAPRLWRRAPVTEPSVEREHWPLPGPTGRPLRPSLRPL